MRWNNLNPGIRFLISFCVIITMLLLSGFWAIHGIGGIVTDASEVIDRNKLRTNLEGKYVDHLLLAKDLIRLLTNKNLTELTIQIGHTKASDFKLLVHYRLKIKYSNNCSECDINSSYNQSMRDLKSKQHSLECPQVCLDSIIK